MTENRNGGRVLHIPEEMRPEAGLHAVVLCFHRPEVSSYHLVGPKTMAGVFETLCEGGGRTTVERLGKDSWRIEKRYPMAYREELDPCEWMQRWLEEDCRGDQGEAGAAIDNLEWKLLHSEYDSELVAGPRCWAALHYLVNSARKAGVIEDIPGRA